MLKVIDRDSDTVFIYGDKEDVYMMMNSFMESKSLVMTYSYDNQPALVVRKQTQTQE